MFKKNIIISIITLFFIAVLPVTHSFSIAMAPNESARGAILIERDSGRILYSKNINQKLPMASTTKIMTALIAIEKGDLDETVIVKEEWTNVEGSSIYLKPNEKVKLKDLVYGLILRSGNDAATAIACHIAGSIDNFSVLMNERAKEIGAINTNFTNPHGLHSENHYTTAYDLALISQVALKNETFRKISKTVDYVSDRDLNSHFYNKNKTLWQYDGGDGVKIGYTQAAGRCLVSSATRDDIQLIAVVLNDNNWFNDCYNLFDYGFNNYKNTHILRKGNFIKNISINNGKIDKLPIVINKDFYYPLLKDEVKDIKISVKIPKTLTAPVKKGTVVGEVNITLKDQNIYKGDIKLSESINEKTLKDKMVNFIDSIF
ncbi:D-alanyl-D-alanine carboxypeptidase [Clostridium sp. D2Q-11]|uniref:serine-type D-Ala-D-Ala carboxypeptidase n=1 Tax=Anaeromonas frigoriresistens TaxID=2683708 RepID=A0A942UVR6_9FIRM|nr:D-alanyl-D-alanine carboxypeptidase family protein [Anaeromonas frigoriresistens]MBS4539958.1 D-alanyl-D-alanine carboxypeptidase [Anaeromonas frigoriresistens]